MKGSEINVYRTVTDVAYGRIGMFNRNEADLFREWYSRRSPLSVKQITTKIASSWFIPVDFHAFIGSRLAISSRARDILHECLKSSAVFRELDFPHNKYYWLDINTLVGCLDAARLEGRRSTVENVGDYWQEVTRWSFDAQALDASRLLFSPERPELRLDIFCTDQFKTLVEDAGLVGLTFQKVWSSVEGGIEIEHEPAVGPVARELGRQIEVRRDLAIPKYGVFYPDASS